MLGLLTADDSKKFTICFTELVVVVVLLFEILFTWLGVDFSLFCNLNLKVFLPGRFPSFKLVLTLKWFSAANLLVVQNDQFYPKKTRKRGLRIED